MPISTMKRLRATAVVNSLFAPTTLKAAVSRLGFVQADPIRSPATAQDLILRPRVKEYHAGDLERKYAALGIEEDYIYAYGFMPRATWQLLHPRNMTNLPPLERKVLEVVRVVGGKIHPSDLEEHLGRERVVNAWGGYSKATTRALEDLHYRGLLRIAEREKGIRIYELNTIADSVLQRDPVERLRELVLILANIFSPAPRKSLQEVVNKLRYSIPRVGDLRTVLEGLIKSGELVCETIDDLAYVYPHSVKIANQAPPVVRILAPFDPVVWDRRRFEHLWDWPYRFEAYTPVAKRLRGYYAMPLLWGDNVIGWVNATGGARAKHLTVDIGYIGKRPREAAFKAELAREIAALEEFLGF